MSARAVHLASIYAPDISDKRSKPNGANITQRPFQEPGDSETLHPEEDGERDPKSRLDYRQKCVENTPDRDVRCQLYSVVTGIDEKETHHFRKPSNRAVAAQAWSHHTRVVRIEASPSPANVHMSM